jgi:myo-inositol-1(or 4)-monophosphatase
VQWSDGRVQEPDPPTAAELETLALELAAGAAEVVRAGRAASFTVDAKSNDTDLVTEVDRASERWLVDTLAQRRPGDRVLGEEGGAQGSAASARVRWVIDPIDGTVNFVLGIPQYAVSVAAEVDGTVIAGAVRPSTPAVAVVPTCARRVSDRAG